MKERKRRKIEESERAERGEGAGRAEREPSKALDCNFSRHIRDRNRNEKRKKGSAREGRKPGCVGELEKEGEASGTKLRLAHARI